MIFETFSELSFIINVVKMDDPVFEIMLAVNLLGSVTAASQTCENNEDWKSSYKVDWHLESIEEHNQD